MKESYDERFRKEAPRKREIKEALENLGGALWVKGGTLIQKERLPERRKNELWRKTENKELEGGARGNKNKRRAVQKNGRRKVRTKNEVLEENKGSNGTEKGN